MKKEETIINYRPKLAKILKNDMKFMLEFYSSNFIQLYYKLLATLYKIKKDATGEILFNNMVEYIDSFNDAYTYFNVHRDEFAKYDEYSVISDHKAFYCICKVFENEFISMKNKVDFSIYTKSEQYMINHFYKILFNPLNNPNLEVQKGQSVCYYDKSGNYGEFCNDIKFSIKFIEKECGSIIELFELE